MSFLTEAGGAGRPQALANLPGTQSGDDFGGKGQQPWNLTFYSWSMSLQGLSGELADGTVGGWGRVQR